LFELSKSEKEKHNTKNAGADREDKVRDLREKRRKKTDLKGEGTHHEGINEKVIVLEGIEGRRSVDSIFVVLAELESCHNSAQSSEHHVVEQLHCRDLSVRFATNNKEQKGIGFGMKMPTRH
jgi:hypothetical protein